MPWRDPETTHFADLTIIFIHGIQDARILYFGRVLRRTAGKWPRIRGDVKAPIALARISLRTILASAIRRHDRSCIDVCACHVRRNGGLRSGPDSEGAARPSRYQHSAFVLYSVRLNAV